MTAKRFDEISTLQIREVTRSGWAQVRDKWRLVWAKLRFPLRAGITWLSALFGISAGIGGLASYLTRDQDAHTLVQSATLAMIALGALVFVGALEYKFFRARNYASVFDLQQSAAERLRDLHAYLIQLIDFPTQANSQITEHDIAQARKIIEEVLDDYAKLFSIGTATRCRLCIKFLRNIDNKFYVFTLARDGLSKSQNLKFDKRRHDEMLDCLDDNSDFLSLWDPDIGDRGYFFSSNLEDERDYRSSSFNFWHNVQGNPHRPMRGGWSLPYRSTIVWPIRHEAKEPLGIMAERCLGFLAVDSASSDAFSERWDAPIGKTLANSLYGVLGLYAEADRLISAADEGEKRVAAQRREPA